MSNLSLTSVMVWVLCCYAASVVMAGPVKVSSQERAAWLRWVIPLPKQIAINGKLEVDATDVKLRVRTGAGEVERNAAGEMAKLFRDKTQAKLDLDRGRFEIFLGVCDRQGRIEDVTLSEAAQLIKRPNWQQAYVIRPVGSNRLVVTALDERGVFYAAQTLRQLLEGRFADGKVTIPMATVTDWPDLAERGQWGGNVNSEIEWMAAHKMNLVESHVSLKVDKDGKGVARADKKLLELGRRHALKLVPIITHLDHLERTGVYDVFPELRGTGKSARSLNHGSLVAPCFSKPKLTDLLADWMTSLAAQQGVTDICTWLTEHHLQCGCEQCQKVGQYVLETRAIVKAWRRVRERYPKLGLRLLLTQGSYATNDKVLADVPAEVGVSYYHGGRTYDSSRSPMIYPLLEDYVAKGRWLGCYPQLTASWRIVCPWSSPQFIKFRMTEFVSKKLQCLCGYATPNNRLYDFNITAAAEWSWNATGRDEREFAAAWATRRDLKDPEAAADWAVMLGPVGWDVYGGRVPYNHFFGAAARMVKKRVAPVLGKGMFRYFPTVEHFDKDLAVCDRALDIAKRLDHPPILDETLVVQGYVRMIKEIYTIAQTVSAKKQLDDKQRAALRQNLSRLSEACAQTTRALKDWEASIGKGKGESRFQDTVNVTEKTAAEIAEGLGIGE